MPFNLRKTSWRTTVFILFLLLTGSMVLATGIGAVRINPVEILKIFFSRIPLLSSIIVHDWPQADETIIWLIRLPRVVLAALVGASLAVAGAVFQGLFRNPMADPYIIGVSSGASLGAAVAIVFSVDINILGLSAVPLLAFIGALLTLIVVYRLSKVGGNVAVLTLLLAGIAVSSLLSAAVSLLMFLGGEKLHQLIFWLMGGFSGRQWNYVKMGIPYFFLGSAAVFFYARDLNAMLLGEEPAQHLGIDVENVKKILLVGASLLTAAAVSCGGVIGFIGLIIPHIVRIMIGPDHRILLPAVAFIGAISLVAADAIARTVLAPMEIPVGIITTLCGGPFFIYLLRQRKNKAL
ncbi:MAG: cobalamin transport system permease protein [Thermosediminibacterales bacterium]|nr:cobalamin transport system permease protein [Thermosediminibacterales bacterium]